VTDLVYVENMRVAEIDGRWLVVNAAGHFVRGPFPDQEMAEDALANYRRVALAEQAEEDAAA